MPSPRRAPLLGILVQTRSLRQRPDEKVIQDCLARSSSRITRVCAAHLMSESEIAVPSHGRSSDKPASPGNTTFPASDASKIHSQKLTSRALLLVSDDPRGRGGVERGIIEVA